MAYIYTLPNATSGMDDVFVQTSSTFPELVPLILMFVWLLVFLGGFVAQKRRTADADASQWALLASVATLMVALLMSTKAGLMNLVTLGVVVGVMILTGLWFFISRERGATL